MKFPATYLTRHSRVFIRNGALALLLIIGLTFSSRAQLSGAYTIGPTGNYGSFTEAVDTLISQGVSGTVVFNVQDGMYPEQITIPAIAGASAANTITFQSSSLDSTAVTMFYSSTSTSDNYLVKLDGANYIKFNLLSFVSTGATYARCIVFQGGASNDTITNCLFTTPSTTSTSTNRAIIYGYGTPDEYNVIQNNIIVNGSHGIYLRGTSTSVLASGNVIQNNQIVDSYWNGIHLYHQDAVIISGNTITMSSGHTSGSGIYCVYTDNAVLVEKNTISLSNGGYGIYLNSNDGNIVQKAEISNNMVYVGGSGTAYGIYCYNSTYQNIFHNSTNVNGSASSGRAFYANGGSNLDVRNNCFNNFSWGYAYYTNSTTNIVKSDYNNLYSTANYLANWNGDYEDFPAFQAASGKDVNSISVNPDYTSTTDLHTNIYTLDGMGDGTVGVTTDIDGDVRAGSPDIGVDEFTGVGVPLAGTYTIGGTAPDFTTISQAVDSMNIVGISASVIFDIRDGSYEEQFQVRPITGSSLTNTVTFQSENRDSSLVDIFFAASSSSYVFRLRAADYVIIRDLTITATGTGSSTAIRLSGNAKWDSIYSCEIVGNTSISGAGSIHGDEALFNNIVIQNNNISSGYYGIRLDNADAILAVGINVSGNVLSGQSEYGILLEDMDVAIVMNNTLDVTGHSGFTGIYLLDVENDFVLTGNSVTSATGTDGGLKIENCTGTSSKRGLVANNVIISGGTNNAYGIYTRSSDYVDVFYNSTRIVSSHLTAGIGYYNYNGSNMDVRNNVFTNFGGGYAYYANNGTAVTSSDYNDLYTTGNFVGYWNGVNQSDLANFQSANSMDDSSISVNPVFVSGFDLHATSSFIDGMGTPLGSVTVDIDGEARDVFTPDMGADEFTPDTAMSPLVGVYTIGGTSPSPDYIDFTTAVDDLNLRGIAGVVTFNVRPGLYPEQVEVLPISGSSATDTVVFQSENGDSSAVVMTYNALSSSDNFVFRLYGASYVTIQNMTLAATSNTYCMVISMNGAVNNINIRNNIISGTINANSSLIYIYDDIVSDIRITNNVLSEGNWGVYINGDNSLHATGIVVNNNVITNSTTTSIRLEDCNAPVVMGNVCSTSSSSNYGITLVDCDNKFKVAGNKIVSNGDYGVYIGDCGGSSPFRGLVANNFCSIGGTSTCYGIYLSNSTFVNVYHNNVNITSTGTGGRAIYLYNGGSNINIKNNNFVNTGPGHAYYIYSNATSAVASSDNNNMTSAGTNLAYWGGNMATLGDLQTASNMDWSTISVNPLYASSTDLHVGAVALMGTAEPSLGIDYDFDGQLRDPVTPDIGADEFFCVTPTFSVSISNPCLGDSTTFVDNSTDIEVGSTWEWDFDNDFVADYTSSVGGETVSYLYSSGGTQTANLIISQIAGCVDTFVMAPVVNTFPVLSLIATGVYCDSSNGTASVVASGGTTPYTYTWSSGGTSSMATALDIGLYTVAVTDGNNCTTLDTVSVGESMEVAVTLIQGSTCGNSDGIAQVDTVTGGYPPYDYVWSTGDTTYTDSSLYSGIHYVSVIDVNGCVAFGTVNVSDIGAGVSVGLLSQTDNMCFGDQNGVINIAAFGGTSPYDIVWSNAATTQSISGLGNGIYEIVVTDALGCVATGSYTITSPDDIAVSVVVSQASCGVSDGSAVITAYGGAQPYSYNWSTGGSNQVASGLAAGIYSVTLTDANGCTEVAGVVISNIGGPVITVNSITEVNCINPAIGAIDIDVTGGLPGYSYLWSNAAVTEDISGLIVGNYTVTVTDTNGCAGTATIDINESVPVTPEICIVTVDSITGSNLIVWDKQIGPNIDYFNIYREGTQSGIYFLVGSRPFGLESYFVDSFANPVIRSWRYRLSAVDSCGQESQMSGIHKTMHLTINVGLGGETNLIWDDYSGIQWQSFIIESGPDDTSLTLLTIVSSNVHAYVDLSPPAGTQVYRVSTNDLPGGPCVAQKVKNFNSSKSNTSSVGGVTDSLSSSISSTNATQGNCDGSATFSVTGGVAPYTYAWGTSPVQTDSVATGLCAGTYGVTVTDDNGDTISSSVAVLEDVNLAGTTSTTNATAGNCDGSATISVIGGTPPYAYSWGTSPVQTDSTATGLCEGTYGVTVTDALGDTISASVTITENQNLSGTSTTTNATAGNCDGTATVTVAGGSPPYTYTWNTTPTQTTATATGLCAGSYSCTVQDSAGGLVIVNATVSEDQALVATASAVDASFGICDGTATAVVTGGFPPYTYTWSTVPVQTTATATGLCPNNYTVFVQDSAGTTTTAAATVGEVVSIALIDLEESLSLYPNPSDGSFGISFIYREGADVVLRLFDMKGGIIWQETVMTTSNRTVVDVDLDSPVSGIYQMQVLTGTGMITRKVLVE